MTAPSWNDRHKLVHYILSCVSSVQMASALTVVRDRLDSRRCCVLVQLHGVDCIMARHTSLSRTVSALGIFRRRGKPP